MARATREESYDGGRRVLCSRDYSTSWAAWTLCVPYVAFKHGIVPGCD